MTLTVEEQLDGKQIIWLRACYLDFVDTKKPLPALWDSIQGINRGEWPTMVELRDWYVQQAYCYLGKESAVARRLGLDVRTVNAILRKEASQLE